MACENTPGEENAALEGCEAQMGESQNLGFGDVGRKNQEASSPININTGTNEVRLVEKPATKGGVLAKSIEGELAVNRMDVGMKKDNQKLFADGKTVEGSIR
jgi:hypothetical protein